MIGFIEIVMAGLVPAIHVLAAQKKKDVDARDQPGHDEHICTPPSGHGR
jgi:hypothetical protein